MFREQVVPRLRQEGFVDRHLIQPLRLDLPEQCDRVAAELLEDARFKDNPARVTNKTALVDALSARTRQRKSAELVDTLRAAGVPAAPILSVDQMLQEPQTRESGVLVGAVHPRLPDYRSIGLPLTWDGVRPAVRRVPPLLGEHSGDILTWLGYTLDDVRSLKGKGVIQ